MDSMTRNYTERSRNEITIAGSLKRLSEEKEAKRFFEIGSQETFYSSVITHSYYAIFYAAKAMLLSKGIKTSSPEIHRRTYDAFKKEFIDTGILDVKLLEIYKKLVIRADTLLEIFKDEKWKRGNFTYNTIPQANKEPAEDSINNARIFVSNMIRILEG